MKKSSTDLIVGIFVLVGILCVGYLTVKLGKMELIGGNYYSLFARFQSASGLKPGASVEIAGVPVGRVDAITLDKKRMAAQVELRIRKDVQLSDDVIAAIKTSGLIGDKFIKLSPGGSDEILKPGGMITETQSAIDLEELISKYVFGSIH